MIGRIERHHEIMMDDRGLRPLGRRDRTGGHAKGGQGRNENHSRRSRSHGVTPDYEGQCFGPMLSEDYVNALRIFGEDLAAR